MKEIDRIQNFADFWPYYLGEHRKPWTRAFHFAGSTGAIACIILFLSLGDWKWLIGAMGIGYGLAWASHFFIEGNKPATFRYPLWSFIADWRMWFLMITGKMDQELTRVLYSPDIGHRRRTE